MAMYTNILVEEKDQIAWVTINRPSFLNALNKETIQELHNAFSSLNENAQIGVIILTGSGEKSFVAGADIKEFSEFTIAQGGELAASGQEKLFNYIENLSKPVIAAVNGFALGGGLELAMSCHIRVASENARMGLPEVSLGVIPGYGGTQRLPQLVGKGKANEMIFTAEMIPAQDALAWGLVNHVVPLTELTSVCETMAQKILKNSPSALSAAIRCVNSGYNPMQNGFEIEIEEFAKCFGTLDFAKGTQAFLSKQKPNFRD